jgi:hypothetical protein
MFNRKINIHNILIFAHIFLSKYTGISGLKVIATEKNIIDNALDVALFFEK